MIIATFYRIYIALLSGIAIYFFFHSFWLAAIAVIITRTLWFCVEFTYNKIKINRLFKKNIAQFKQQFGPYGIRIANKAENIWQIKKSLVEVFTENTKTLKKCVEQLEVMDTLFKAGLKPEGDEFLLHDLKLRYGKDRLEKMIPPETKLTK